MISAKSERPEKHVLEMMKWLTSETIEQIIYPRSHDVRQTTKHSKKISWSLFNTPIKEKEQSTVISNLSHTYHNRAQKLRVRVLTKCAL